MYVTVEPGGLPSLCRILCLKLYLKSHPHTQVQAVAVLEFIQWYDELSRANSTSRKTSAVHQQFPHFDTSLHILNKELTDLGLK